MAMEKCIWLTWTISNLAHPRQPSTLTSTFSSSCSPDATQLLVRDLLKQLLRSAARNGIQLLLQPVSSSTDGITIISRQLTQHSGLLSSLEATTTLFVGLSQYHSCHSNISISTAVDWGAGANSNYVLSRNRVAAVAATVARFIDFLHLNGFLANFNRLNIVGHSLGAHIAGITGKRVSRGRVQAIFGLDPAGPLFSVGDVANRLATTDAVYTEMLATNAGTLGFDQPIAAASFYRRKNTFLIKEIS